MDERETYIAAMEDLRVDKNLGANIAKVVANEAAAEAEETNRAKNAAAAEKAAKKAKKGLVGWRGWQKALAGVLSFMICVTSAVGLMGGFPSFRHVRPNTATIDLTPDVKTEAAKLMTASSYDDVYEALKKTGLFDRYADYNGIWYKSGIRFYGVAKNAGSVDYAMPEEAPQASEPTAPTATGNVALDTASGADNGSDDYSTTNLQVAGVDEADIVKTDGRYIYAIGNNTLYVVSAAGADSKLLSETKLVTEFSRPVTDGTKHFSSYPREMYLAGDRLIVIRDKSVYFEPDLSGYDGELYYNGFNYKRWYGWYNTDRQTEAVFYDISDPANPVEKTAAAQDGGYLNSRLADGVLYLITNHNIYQVDENGIPELDPAVYVPCTYGTANGTDDATFTDGDPELEKCPLEPSCIAIMPNVTSTQYLVVSGVDAASGAMLGSQSVLGGGTQIYMSRSNLYVSLFNYRDEVIETTREADGVEIRHHEEGTFTDILRIALNGGYPELMATGSLPGEPINQFAMDEYDGTFRIVTQIWNYSYDEHVYPEDYTGIYRNDNWQNENTNAVFVLDRDMNVIGQIRDLSKDERVYSVRFDGPVGYVVTFRQTDPLFTIDFSDPANPAIRSALKIPGFSEYMHIFKEGLLFGLGYDADEETGRTNGMKMSMFDVSDPYDVTEIATLKLNANYSEALYNHKAILVDAGKNLIAFPADNGYVVYGYDAIAQRFFLKGSIKCSDSMWWGEPRGLYANGFFYVVSVTDVVVLDLEKLTEVTTVELPNDGYEYYEIYRNGDDVIYD